MSARICFLLFACLVQATTVAAPLVLPGSQELIRQRQQQLLEQQNQRLEELQQLPGQQAPAEPISAPAGPPRCFPVKRIHLQGASLISAAEQDTLLKPFIDQCLGVEQLNALLKAITDYYLNHGYVTTRAYLPQQDLADGELEIRVVEGLLQEIDGGDVACPRELAMSFPGQTGEALNLRDLEQLLDQLNRLPSLQVQVQIAPGNELGSSRAQLSGQRQKPWRVSANRNNDGLPSTGEQQWGVGLDWDSPLGLADQLSLRGGGDTVSDHWTDSNNQSLFYSLPYGWWTFSYSYSENTYRSQNEAAGFDFKQNGDSQTQQLRAERVLHRDDVSKTAASISAGQLRTRNYLEDTLVDVSSQTLSNGQLGFNHGRRIGSAFVNLDLAWQRGTGWFDAQSNGNPHGALPVARYNLYSATLSYLQPFRLWDESFSVQSLATGQQSEDVLFSPLRFSVGGLSSVRGFKEQSITGDSGGYWRNQLSWQRPVTWAVLQPWVNEYGAALAYDVGVIQHGRYNPLAHGRMTGQALELNASGPNLAASLTFSQSLERPAYITEDESPVYFRVELFF